MVVKAGHSGGKFSRESLGSLCASYWHPVYTFIRRKGFDSDEARDCTQEFFTRVIEKDYLGDVDRSKGRFRSFLLAAVSHFLSNHLDSGRAQKRGGGQEAVSLESEGVQGRRHEPAHASTPEALFEYDWALTLLERALDRLRAEYADPDFLRLKPFLLGEVAHGQLAATAQQWGASEGSFKVAVHRMRKRYREALRTEIAETVSEPGQVEEEIRYLMAVLARGGELRRM
jgi:RNA polymerase sigma-70 factor (ECF subfamily)